jgi:hypothetical protein
MKTREEVELKKYLYRLFDKDGVAVNFTFKTSHFGQRLDEITVEESLKHFANFISRKVYGKAFDRGKKRVSFLYSIERGSLGLLHVHGFLPFPEKKYINWFDFSVAIRTCWRKSRWGNKRIKNEFTYDRRTWINYCLKRRTKTDGVLNGVGWYC